ncbi:MAG: hypothetical protein AAGG68_02385 [Bacteroidota bacterium]
MWQKRSFWAVGGLREIGFKSNSDLLMVLSSQGRGIFDCITNKKIGRDYLDYYMEDWDENSGIVEGFGILKNEKIMCGGFEAPDILKKETDDGWIVKTGKEIRPNWQKKKLMAEVMFIQKANPKEKIEIGVFHYGINRSYGFSDTGNSFVLATSSDLSVWNRAI